MRDPQVKPNAQNTSSFQSTASITATILTVTNNHELNGISGE
ncbi:hypothetical protein Pan181_27810 [Aeoliella mucimassa]|uniref:Uncharacterized protein n=1 Tax=Aeoliella mucimassa TaxID=2527972 RepID=A0A518APD2_9BACT|nr:hypothetical protein Pan181_27810 [Aeoliella mucimassa]